MASDIATTKNVSGGYDSFNGVSLVTVVYLLTMVGQ